MELISKHVSPDGLLTLKVERDGDNTVIGFDSFAWSTSSEFLAAKWRISRDAAITRFIDEVLGNRATIAVAHVGKVIRDVWVTDRPASELKYKRHEETILFRFWNGSAWDSEDARGDPAG